MVTMSPRMPCQDPLSIVFMRFYTDLAAESIIRIVGT